MSCWRRSQREEEEGLEMEERAANDDADSLDEGDMMEEEEESRVRIIGPDAVLWQVNDRRGDNVWDDIY